MSGERVRSIVARRIAACGLGSLLISMADVSLAQPEQEADRLEEVIVTGSRIERTGLTTPTPVTVLDEAALKISANTNLADTLFDLPQSGVPGVSQTNSNFAVLAPGLAEVDLRNLGVARTLVLVNGRRHVGGDSENPSVVDLNSIPADFIDRIEVITGGASAVYGSEAMAGVINVITKQDFEGINLDIQTGTSSESDGGDTSIGLTAGRNFADERGNAIFHIGYQNLEDITSSDRRLARSDNFLGDFNSFSSFAPQGSIQTPTGQFITQAPDASWTKPFDPAEDGFNRAAFRKIQLPLERRTFAANLNYELADNVNLFVETSFTNTSTDSNLEPTITGDSLTVGDQDLVLPGDNPFIPPGIVAAYAAEGVALPDPDVDIVFRKRFLELGPRKTAPERDTTRVALGFEGEVNDNWNYEGYYQWGRTETTLRNTGDFNTFFFQQGLDVEPNPENPGGFRCRDTLARSLGCVPIDIFGVGSISAEAVNFVQVPAQSTAEIQQQTVGISLAGDLFELPSGRLGVAVGAEWRKEQLDRQSDALAAAGLSSSNATAPVRGSYDVWEAYGEISVPLLSDLPGASYLGFDAAYRYADYSTVGTVDSWKLGVEWAPVDDVRFRGAIAQATRAPNTAELFEPGSETFQSFIDPCTNGGIGQPGNTRVNCALAGIAPGFDPGTVGSSAGGFQSGNLNLSEETADTVTFGFVLQPRWFDNASLTVDYYDIKIEDAIELIDPQVKLNNCFAAADFPNNSFCEGITRDPVQLIVDRLNFSLENIAELNTRGVDMEFNYTFDWAAVGLLNFNLMSTYTDKWERELLDGSIEDNLREPGFNKWKFNTRLTYSREGWSAAWSTRYIGSGKDDNDFTPEDWPNNHTPDAWYNDLYASYTVETEQSYEVYAGVNNVADLDPPYIPEPSQNTVIGTGTAADVYDVIGRFWYAGVRVRF